jgi:hypothetical protein
VRQLSYFQMSSVSSTNIRAYELHYVMVSYHMEVGTSAPHWCRS